MSELVASWQVRTQRTCNVCVRWSCFEGGGKAWSHMIAYGRAPVVLSRKACVHLAFGEQESRHLRENGAADTVIGGRLPRTTYDALVSLLVVTVHSPRKQSRT